MPTLTVDGIEVEVPQGATVLRLATLICVVAGLAGLTCVGPVNAQTSAWRLKSEQDETHRQAAKDAARGLVDMARCMVSRRYDKARATVAQPYGSAEQAAAVRAIFFRRGTEEPCLDNGMFETRIRLGPDIVAGGLAQALIRKDYPDLPAVVGGWAPEPGKEAEALAQAGGTEAFGRCLVQRDPQAALALVTSVVATPEEAAAVRALQEHLGPCLPAGQKMTINRLFLRNIIAFAGYRLAQEITPRPTGYEVRR